MIYLKFKYGIMREDSISISEASTLSLIPKSKISEGGLLFFNNHILVTFITNNIGTNYGFEASYTATKG